MKSLVGNRLPKFSEEQSKMIKESIEFVGVNYYTARYVDSSTSSANLNLSYTTDSHVIQSSKLHNLCTLQLIFPFFLKKIYIFLTFYTFYYYCCFVPLAAEKNGIPIGQKVFSFSLSLIWNEIAC